MAKRDDSELDVWRLRYPSAGVSWNLIPDPASCQQFIGEAKNMLYRLKNRMNIAVPKLKSLRDERSPEPGSTITVASIFGQDFIEIDVSRGLGGRGKCTITFIDFPLYVPPMRNPGEIKIGEVQGVDYFKTYYSIDLSKCPTCQVTSWEFLFRYLQSSPLVPLPKPPLPISTRIEWPIEPLHHHDYDADGLLLDHDGTDHTIYSLSSPAWGEVISYGTDNGGTYIIWKAYTESGTGVIYSRTGLGIMRLVARVKDNKGIEICAQNERIEVDCCLKDDEHRQVEIWWEDSGTCQPFIIHPGVLYDAICKIETSISMSGLVWYACTHPQQPFYAIPEILGTCLPVEWTLSGPIDFLNSKKNDNSIFIKCLSAECHAEASITLRDRCGGEYIINVRPYCQDADALAIGYTSLQMSCNGSQTLDAAGGFYPYSWSLSGGGTITPAEDTKSAVYAAPATNENCASNPTITLTDCCGESQSISLAVNCYTVATVALRRCEITVCATCDNTLPPVGYWRFKAIQGKWNYQCNGVLLDEDFLSGGGIHVAGFDCVYDSGITWGCAYLGPSHPCSGDIGGTKNLQCQTGCIPLCTPPGDVCGLNDKRTALMKTQGCCPLNPLTGLPY